VTQRQKTAASQGTKKKIDNRRGGRWERLLYLIKPENAGLRKQVNKICQRQNAAPLD
jgi:hypothetical protein